MSHTLHRRFFSILLRVYCHVWQLFLWTVPVKQNICKSNCIANCAVSLYKLQRQLICRLYVTNKILLTMHFSLLKIPGVLLHISRDMSAENKSLSHSMCYMQQLLRTGNLGFILIDFCFKFFRWDYLWLGCTIIPDSVEGNTVWSGW